MKKTAIEYEVYKGLQKPLIFKGMKGKFIYYTAGGVILTFLLTVVIFIVIGKIAGLLTFVLGIGITFFIIRKEQKFGLHKKTMTKGFVIINPKHYK